MYVHLLWLCFLIIRRTPHVTHTDTLFPFTSHFRADQVAVLGTSRFSRGGSGASAWTWNQMFSAMLVTWSPTRSRFLAMNSRCVHGVIARASRSEEHTSELQSLMRISYAVFCLQKKKYITQTNAPRLPLTNYHNHTRPTSS